MYVNNFVAIKKNEEVNYWDKYCIYTCQINVVKILLLLLYIV